jgi:hypothetical protein
MPVAEDDRRARDAQISQGCKCPLRFNRPVVAEPRS